MQLLIGLMGVFYLIVTAVLALYGFHNLITTILYLRMRRPSKRTIQKGEIQPLQEWPPVTVQLPIFNEKYTIERLLNAVTRLDYPADRLQIQVLDDSTDDTFDLLSKLVEEYKSRGGNIELIHRVDRTGYKAGALGNGLLTATGELVAIFDADFVPKPDWLKQTVPSFQNPRLGCLQTRWGHTNQQYNSLTRAEAMGIDGHFIIEQTVRSKNGFFLNFNGTAGLWRRACIEDAGGWQWDTLTEDLDLSYRAQMRGWKFDYLPDVVVPAELPPQVEAYKKQQFRWAKGSFQVVRKILPSVLRAKLPLKVRFMALLHLTGYFVHPLMLSLLLLTLPVGLFIPVAFKIFPISVFAGLGPPLLYLTATATQHRSVLRRLRSFPLLVIVGFGLSLSTTIAVLEGLFSKGGAFIRTPKLNLGNRRKGAQKIDRAYIAPLSSMVWVEIGLGIYALLTGILLAGYVGWGIVPWMAIYMFGYFYIAGLNLIQHRIEAN
ncbi:MAG TPA: cellulose synthase family protein [Anaerolineales bacterium]|nr:cellulose synthase family protein [Anaerolineales bacterium]